MSMLMGKKTLLTGSKKVMEETSGRATEDGSLFEDGQMLCVQKKSNKSQFTSYNDRMSDINDICEVCGTRGRLSRTRHQQVVPEPHNLLSTLVTWRKTDHTRQLVIDREMRIKRLQDYRNIDMRR